MSDARSDYVSTVWPQTANDVEAMTTNDKLVYAEANAATWLAKFLQGKSDKGLAAILALERFVGWLL